MVMDKLKLEVDTILYRIDKYINYVKPILANPESDVDSAWDLFSYGPSFIYDGGCLDYISLPKFTNISFNNFVWWEYEMGNSGDVFDWVTLLELYLEDLSSEKRQITKEEIDGIKREILQLGYRQFTIYDT